MTNFFLKSIVTQEQLKAKGFKIKTSRGRKYANKGYGRTKIYINLDSETSIPVRIILWQFPNAVGNKPLKPYLQKLIDKGYVEESTY